MKTFLLLFSAVLLPLTIMVHGVAQETPADPRLKAILDEIAAMQATVTAQKDERTQQYLVDLETLEKATQATGNLDKVLQVSNEREAWKSGEHTPAIDPRDESVILGLRKLRYYFDRDIDAIETASEKNSEERRAVIEGKFVELEKVLTTEGKIPLALETRKLGKQFAAGDLDSRPVASGKPNSTAGKPDATPMPASAEKAATGDVSFPLTTPKDLPTLPNELGRLVLVPYPGASVKFDQRLIQEVERKDYGDLVMLGENMSANAISAIRSNGNPVLWRSNGNLEELRNVSALRVWTGPGEAGLVWLDNEGRAGTTVDDREFSSALEDLREVRYFTTTSKFAFAVDESGNRYVVGPGLEHPNLVRAFQDKDLIVSAAFGGPNFVMILNDDGSLIEFLHDKAPQTLAPSQSHSVLVDYSLALNINGEPSTFGLRENLKTFFDQVKGTPTRSKSLAGFIQTIQIDNREWLILERDKANWSRMGRLEQALSGALDIFPTNAGLVAILPASEVSRSGFWEVDELIAARK